MIEYNLILCCGNEFYKENVYMYDIVTVPNMWLYYELSVASIPAEACGYKLHKNKIINHIAG